LPIANLSAPALALVLIKMAVEVDSGFITAKTLAPAVRSVMELVKVIQSLIPSNFAAPR